MDFEPNEHGADGVTAGQARHNLSNVGGVTAGHVGHNSSVYNVVSLYNLYICAPEPGRSTLNVLNYKYKYFPPEKYLSTSTFHFGEMYLSTFRVLSKCT